MSSVNVGEKDKLKVQVVGGTGVAKYIEGASGLNYDAIYNGTNELEALQMIGGFISYQHFWKSHIYSSLTAGFLDVEKNQNLVAKGYQSGYYGSANLFWEAVKNLTFGFEAVAGERVNVNDQKGSAFRMQMSATYNFNKNFK
jgi:hypothetical protein